MIKICEHCGSEYKTYHRKQKFCTQKCYLCVPSRNPFFGKKHSKSSIQKMSYSQTGKTKTEEFRKQRSESYSGEGNPFFGKEHSPETEAKIKKSLKGKNCGSSNPFFGKNHTFESRKKMSQIRSKKIATGEINPINRGIRGYYNGIRFDSVYELGRIKQLEVDHSIRSFARNSKISIEYFWKNSWHIYYPDFMIFYNDDAICIEEVKGYESEKDKVKHKFAKQNLSQQGIDFKVLYKESIFKSDSEYRTLLNEWRMK